MVLYPNKLPESERVCSGICKEGIRQVSRKRKQEYKGNGGKLHVGKATSRRSLLLEEYVIKTCGIFFFYLCQTVFTRIEITWNIKSLILRVA